MNKFKFSLFFRHAVNLVFAILFVFPISTIYNPFASYIWMEQYIYSEGPLKFFAPFGILWILFQVVKNKRFRNLAKWLCFILTALYFVGSLSSILVPIQDYVPDYGSLLLLLLFPLIAFMIFFEKREQRENIDTDYEDILDV